MGDLATITRRGLVQAGAVALAGMGIPMTAEAGIPASNPDAALLALIARHPEVLAECVGAEDEAERLEHEAGSAHPPRPNMLRYRPGDFPRTSYGRAASDPVGDTEERWYSSRGVEWLRVSEFVAQWTEEAEARRWEIVEAHDRWRAECCEVDDRAGLPVAEQAKRAAVLALREVEREIQETEARTLPGLRAKALWVADHIAFDPYADEDLGEIFARQVAAFAGVAT